MSASPLVFTYNIFDSRILGNIFVDGSGSPLPGTSNVTLNTLSCPNVNVQGITLTLQIYGNEVKPELGAQTSLRVANFTIIASSATNTLGTLTYTQQIQNPVRGNDPLIIRSRVAKISSYVNSASGIFANYLFGNVIFQYDNTNNKTTSGNRTISIYSAE
jgi:hypothetical protein